MCHVLLLCTKHIVSSPIKFFYLRLRCQGISGAAEIYQWGPGVMWSYKHNELWKLLYADNLVLSNSASPGWIRHCDCKINAWTHLPDHVFQIFDLKMRATAFDLVWEDTKSRQACEALQDGGRPSGLGVCQMWGLGARVDRQGPSFCRRGSGTQLSSGDSTSLNVPLSIN